MSDDRTPRVEQERAYAELLKGSGTYTPTGALALPDLGPDLKLRWVRARIDGTGQWDHANLNRYRQQHWRPLRPVELPPGFVAQRARLEGDDRDVVMQGNMMLMVWSTELAKSREAYYEQRTRDAVNQTRRLHGLADDGGKLPTVDEDRGSGVQYGVKR